MITSSPVERAKIESAMRIRIGILGRIDPIPGAAHGLDQLAIVRCVDLLAQRVDVDLDEIRLRPEVEVPDMLRDHRFGDDPTGIAHQILEDGKLFGGESDWRSRDGNLPRGGIEYEVAEREHGRRPRPAAEERPDARQQLGKGEGLDEVILGAQVKPRDAIVDRVASGEEEDRRSLGGRAPDAAAELEPVNAWQV